MRDLAFLDLPDVAFVHGHQDLHLLQVLGDHEELRRLQAGGDRLPDVHIPLDDHAVDRRLDLRVAQVLLGPLQRGPR